MANLPEIKLGFIFDILNYVPLWFIFLIFVLFMLGALVWFWMMMEL